MFIVKISIDLDQTVGSDNESKQRGEEMETIAGIEARCPWCGRVAICSPSKGIWCRHCKNGTKTGKSLICSMIPQKFLLEL